MIDAERVARIRQRLSEWPNAHSLYIVMQDRICAVPLHVAELIELLDRWERDALDR